MWRFVVFLWLDFYLTLIHSAAVLPAIFDIWGGPFLIFRKTLRDYFCAELCNRGIIVNHSQGCISSLPVFPAISLCTLTSMPSRRDRSALHFLYLCFPCSASSSEVEKGGHRLLHFFQFFFLGFPLPLFLSAQQC